MKKKKTYAAPAEEAESLAAIHLLVDSITSTDGADGLGTGGEEGTGEAGIGFGNTKEREGEWKDGLW